MNIITSQSLLQYNSFRVDEKATFFFSPESEEQLVDFLISRDRKESLFVLGSGCNVLFTKMFEGCVLHPIMKGIKVIDETSENIFVEVAAGEDWEDFVELSIKKGWNGIENLTMIPGSVGAAPVQNIGAYGVEVSDRIFQVKGRFLESAKSFVFSNAECFFNYRDSIFKNKLKGEVVIISVIFSFPKKKTLHLEYGAIQKKLDSLKISNPSILDVSNIVKEIRSEKLPSVKELGSAGSFFKNPIVSKKHFDSLLKSFPEIPFFNTENGIKLAAGWLIDKCGWKGYRDGDAGVHKNQALVIVNYGNASGNDILRLAKQIEKSVFEKFGVELAPEVNILP